LNLNELRSVQTVAALGYSITRAAEFLHASQPGISRHVSEVESALGVELFIRNKNRLVGLTPAGSAVVPLLNGILTDVENIHRVASRFASGETGALCVATSHTHARYLLPPIIQHFIGEFPKVDLRLRQGYVNHICKWVADGQADLSVSSAPQHAPPELELFPLGELQRIILALPGHPVLLLKRPTLAQLAEYPLITYEQEFNAYADIVGAFRVARLTPRVVLTTGDTDIMKTYVQCGLGIAIVANHCFDPAIDVTLRSLDVKHLFPSTPLYVGIKRGRPLSLHALRFIELLEPQPGALIGTHSSAD